MIPGYCIIFYCVGITKEQYMRAVTREIFESRFTVGVEFDLSVGTV